MLNVFEPFDYLRGTDGNVYVVRGVLRDGHSLVVHPIYSIVDGELRKLNIKASPTASIDLNTKFSEILDVDCCIVANSVISTFQKARARPIGTVQSIDSEMRGVTYELLKRASAVFLYGSRALAMGAQGSDWDFLLSMSSMSGGCLTTRQILEELFTAGVMKPYGSDDIEALISKYQYSETCISKNTLRKVLERCLPFGKAGEKNVDLFTLRDGKNMFMIEQLYEGFTTIEGILLRSGGESFMMPRKIRISTVRGIAEVWHLAWLLAGLDEMAGSRIRLTNTLLDKTGRVWFAPHRSVLEILA
jgi:hypothetical protein